MTISHNSHDPMTIVSKGDFHLNGSTVGRMLPLYTAQEPFLCLASSDHRGRSVTGGF